MSSTMNPPAASISFEGKRVTVMGLGRFGGGVAAAQFLSRRGARVTVTDVQPEAELTESLAQLDGFPIADCHCGGHVQSDFTEADLVVANPAVRRDNRFLELARRAGVPLSSEMNLFWQLNRGRVIGVTGSNGKSTTTALIHSILQAAGWRAWLGGNIGRSLLPVVDEIKPGDWSVLELSSFQLDDLNHLCASPEIAVVTNFSPNHLDWHGSLEEYRRAKQTIFRWQTSRDAAILNRDDPALSGWPVNGREFWFGSAKAPSANVAEFARIRAGGNRPNICESSDNAQEPAAPRGVFLKGGSAFVRDGADERTLPIGDWLRLPGRHNLQNAAAATCAALAAGVDDGAVRRGLEQFAPLPHRLQFVAEVAGRKFYNDSLATTPESVEVALDAFTAPVVLLAGGYDKQVDLTQMARAIAGKVKAVALMGQTAAALAKLITAESSARPRSFKPLQMTQCDSFTAAFDWAVAQSAPGDIVLLSPGCASYDWFRNFTHRGDEFTRLVGARLTAVA
jgi:UDP-N-acetylmuramoylalanine--D-glutamate ligase